LASSLGSPEKLRDPKSGYDCKSMRSMTFKRRQVKVTAAPKAKQVGNMFVKRE
jgi:hypothetical protein